MRIKFVVCVCVAASVEQINKAKDIIKKLTFKFESEAFENPGTCEIKTKGLGGPINNVYFSLPVCAVVSSTEALPAAGGHCSGARGGGASG